VPRAPDAFAAVDGRAIAHRSCASATRGSSNRFDSNFSGFPRDRIVTRRPPELTTLSLMHSPARQVLAGHSQQMKVMSWVWPITALYFGPLALWPYMTIGRHAEKGAPHSTEMPFWQTTLVATTHCGAGCTLGDIVAAFAIGIVFFNISRSCPGGRSRRVLVHDASGNDPRVRHFVPRELVTRSKRSQRSHVRPSRRGSFRREKTAPTVR